MTTTPALNDDLVQSARNQLALIHSLTNDTTEANWADKRLYVMQTCVRLSDDLAALEAQSKEIEALRAALEDGDNVHLNMLRGTIAKPSVEQIVHIYPEIAGWRDALRRLVNPAPGVRALPAWVYGIVNAALKEGA
jgi:hypothetical protein